eukprot:gene9380-1591_t
MKMSKFPNDFKKRTSEPGEYSDDDEIIELDLNDGIEDNENLISELLEESPKEYKKKRTEIQGYFNTNTKSLFECRDEKETKITKKYYLKQNDTLLFKGKEKELYVMKIKQGEETIQLSTSIIEQYYEWLSIFEECKIKKSNIQFTSEKSPRTSIHIQNERNEKIDNLDFIYWKEKHIQEWLKNILFFFSKEEKLLNQIFDACEKKKIIGIDLNQKFNLKKILELNDTPISDLLLDIEDEINDNISKLKLDRTFDRPKNIVSKKIFKSYPEQFMKNKRHYFTLASNLCSENGLKNYLSMDLKGMKEMMDKWEYNKINSNQFERIAKVKLVITSTHYPENIRKLALPILTPLNFINTNYGMFHTALIIGPFYLDWNSGELCVPKRIMKSQESFFTADVAEMIILNDDMNDVIKKLSIFISHWNINYSYGSFKIGKKRNCQDFVDELLKFLNVKLNIQSGSCIDQYLKSAKKGICDSKFFCSDSFEKSFSSFPEIFERKKKPFLSHEELDKFVIKLKEMNPKIESEYKDEWNLLKSYDRGYWLKYYGETSKKSPNQQRLKEFNYFQKEGESQNKSICSCPFGDPKLTGSFR